jgi:hypothetical protein
MKNSKPKRPLPRRYNGEEARAIFRAAIRKSFREVFGTPKPKRSK